MRRALSAPARWIAENAGAEGGVVVARIAELPAGHGYNAATGEYGDLVAQGVIDPVKVTRSAVQNAASIAGMLLTTEALVTEKPEPAAGRRWRSRPPALTQFAPEPAALCRGGGLRRSRRLARRGREDRGLARGGRPGVARSRHPRWAPGGGLGRGVRRSLAAVPWPENSRAATAGARRY